MEEAGSSRGGGSEKKDPIEDPNLSKTLCGDDDCVLCAVFGRVHSWKNSSEVLQGEAHEVVHWHDGSRFLVHEVANGSQPSDRRIIMSYTSSRLVAEIKASGKSSLRFFFFWAALLLLFYMPQLIILAFVFDLVYNMLMPHSFNFQGDEISNSPSKNEDKSEIITTPCKDGNTCGVYPCPPREETPPQPSQEQDNSEVEFELVLSHPCKVGNTCGVHPCPPKNSSSDRSGPFEKFGISSEEEYQEYVKKRPCRVGNTCGVYPCPPAIWTVRRPRPARREDNSRDEHERPSHNSREAVIPRPPSNVTPPQPSQDQDNSEEEIEAVLSPPCESSLPASPAPPPYEETPGGRSIPGPSGTSQNISEETPEGWRSIPEPSGTSQNISKPSP